MDISKIWSSSILGVPDGYSAKRAQVETLSEDEDERDTSAASLPADAHVPLPGGPFSALTPSMWPQDLLGRPNSAPEDKNGQVDYRYDEFGFKVEEEDGPEENSSKLLSTPFVECDSHRLQWIAHLEFTQNKPVTDLTWDKIDAQLMRSDKLRSMIRDRGIPHSLRPQIWQRLCGATRRRQATRTSYKDFVKSSANDLSVTSKQIEKDLMRTLPNSACFCNVGSTGIARLRRVLRAIGWLYTDIGYCQGTGMIAASLLLFLEEEDVFWVMCSIIEDLLPVSYYNSTLLGVQADQRVLRQLLASHLPELDVLLTEHDIELSLISLHWFLTAFSSIVHMKVLLRIWDLFFYEGSIVFFQITMGMLKLKETKLLSLTNSAEIFNVLSDIPGQVTDVDQLIKVSMDVAGMLSDVTVDACRRKHLGYLLADQGAIIDPEKSHNLPKQTLSKRQVKQTRSLLGMLLWHTDNSTDVNNKAKNICQTELLVDLRESIMQLSRHFQSVDPRNHKLNTQPDYSMESHQHDLENYVNVARNRRRRAKALLDFERHDDDELGFRRNDIITIISQRDEHCWIGELNGLNGWFPAKFVEMLDERSKFYSSAGDDSISETITDLVRGVFCAAMKAVFEHGLKRSSLLVGPGHPWLFIEQASSKEVERDFNSVYSRLVLCKTYRLDEDGKVLTPEEILYRSVQSVNLTHDAVHAQMDVKFRSLICCGLNEQALHLWLETLCSSQEIIEKWYHPWSFMRSPGWVQVKCELRVLALLSFQLNYNREILRLSAGYRHLSSGNRTARKLAKLDSLRGNVRDMLIKHHLFSWES